MAGEGLSCESILREAPKNGRLAQAYLIHASNELSAEAAAEDFIKRVLCESHTACGRCPSCMQFDGDDHPDMLTVQREGKDKAIKKEQVEAIPAFISETAFNGAHKCVYIREADTMTPLVQNKLLKSIEEPPEGVIFVLATALPSQLLTTVRSRCVDIRIRPLPRAEIERRIDGRVPRGREQMLAAFSDGSEREALRLSEDTSFDEGREAAFEFCGMLRASRSPSLFKLTQLLESDPEARAMLVVTVLTDAARLGMSADTPPYSADKTGEVRALSEYFTAAGLSSMADIMLSVCEKKRRCPGLSARPMIESAIFRLMEVRNRCLK